MKRVLVFICILSGICGCGRHPLRVGYWMPDPPDGEDRAALEWLKSDPGFVPFALSGENLENQDPDVVWIHCPDSLRWQRWTKDRTRMAALRSISRSVPIFLTGFAAHLPHVLGIETNPAEVRREEIEQDLLFDKKGLQSWRGHPAFDGLHGGTYLFDGNRDTALSTVGYFNAFPREGRVVAVEKSYIRIHAERRLMVEYSSPRMLCVGGFVLFSPVNGARKELEIFTSNCLRILCGTRGKTTYWKEYELKPVALTPHHARVRAAAERRWAKADSSDLSWKSESRDNFFDLAGRRILVMGKERGGLDEIWTHPFRVFRQVRSFVLSDTGIVFLDSPRSVTIRPESLVREYAFQAGLLREIVMADIDRPGCVLHYEFDGTADLLLGFICKADQRWMWPYDEKALGDVIYGYDEEMKAFWVIDGTGGFCGIAGADAEPISHIEGPYSNLRWVNGWIATGSGLNEAMHGTLFRLDAMTDRALTIVFAGTDQGEGDALLAYSGMLEDPERAYKKTVSHYRGLDRLVTVDTPDDEFDGLWRWALVGTDRFIVRTPDLGTGLTAGYSTTERGWNGGHAVNGRPGYGWYFGRDASWSGFALDDAGDFETVREQLLFFEKFQAPSGKIFHELSTSGAVHYDAADATPLYIMLAGHHYRASGDHAFVRRIWPSIKKAVDFLYETDSDGDGLIENTEGHGWVEGGALYGSHTTFYLAGLWAQTLVYAAELADCAKEHSLAEKYRKDAEGVRIQLDLDFWNALEDFSYYGKFEDGTYNPEKTVLPATVMAWGFLDEGHAESMLEVYAGNGFSSDWGVRILGSDSPLYNPSGYHYGSVWPLFTGWTALAEYEYGRPVQGFTHLANNMRIKNHWAAGFVEEVMHGELYQPSGVCPHQCWSETNILHPGVTGMIGWKPEAPLLKAALKPRIPWNWDRFEAKNLRVGRSTIDFRLDRGKGFTEITLARNGRGPAITVDFFPEVLLGMAVDSVWVDGRAVSFDPQTQRGLLAVPIEVLVRSRSKIRIHHHGGFAPIPHVPRPQPGERSQGYRIIRSAYRQGIAEFVFEGRSGTEDGFQIRILDGEPLSVEGALLKRFEGGIAFLSVPFPVSGEPFSSRTVLVRLSSTPDRDSGPQ